MVTKTLRRKTMALTDLNTLAQIAKTIDADDFDCEFVGLRVVSEDCDGYELNVGDDAPNSYVWDDGEWTDEELDGTCCISLKYLAKLAPWARMAYSGRKVWLIGSDYAEGGVDGGELIIKDAKILAVYDVDNMVLS
jgi:hypothetical protein